MPMPTWDDLAMSEEDRALYEKAGMTGQVTPPGTRPSILVVDMNSAFGDGRYPTASEATGRAAAKAIAALLDHARPSGVPIFYITGLTTHSQAVRGRWKSEYGRLDHPLLSQPAANEIVAEVKPEPADVVLSRSRPSAFWGTGLVDVNAAVVGVGVPGEAVDGWNSDLMHLKQIQAPVPYEELVWQTARP
jgi:maleamate amidohydrolase